MLNSSSLFGLDWSRWFYGLVSGVISGGANAASGGIASVIVDPKDFNLGTGKFWTLVGVTFTIGAVTNFFNYLKSNPAPAFRTQSETVRTEPSGTVTTTTKKTEVVLPPAPPEK